MALSQTPSRLLRPFVPPDTHPPGLPSGRRHLGTRVPVGRGWGKEAPPTLSAGARGPSRARGASDDLRPAMMASPSVCPPVCPSSRNPSATMSQVASGGGLGQPVGVPADKRKPLWAPRVHVPALGWGGGHERVGSGDKTGIRQHGSEPGPRGRALGPGGRGRTRSGDRGPTHRSGRGGTRHPGSLFLNFFSENLLRRVFQDPKPTSPRSGRVLQAGGRAGRQLPGGVWGAGTDSGGRTALGLSLSPLNRALQNSSSGNNYKQQQPL